MPILLHIVAQKVAQEHRFESYPIVIGRLPGNQIVLQDSQISRRHARVVSDPSGVQVEDLNSTNFVYLNGKRVIRANVAHGDVINVGGVADFIFLTRRDEELVSKILLRMPAPAPSPAGEGNGAGTQQAAQAADPGAPNAGAAAPVPEGSKPQPASPAATPLSPQETQVVRILPKLAPPPAAPLPSPIASSPYLDELQRLAALTALLLGPQQGVDDGLRQVIDEAVAAVHARRGFLLVKTARIGQPETWQAKLCRSADSTDIEDEEREMFALELVEHAAATEEITRSGLPGLDEQVFGAKPLLRAMREAICAPLKSSDRVLGALYADGCKEDPGLLARGLMMFEQCAQWAAVGLERQRLASQLAEQHQRFLKTAEELKTANRKLREIEEELEKRRSEAQAPPKPAPPQPDLDLGGADVWGDAPDTAPVSDDYGLDLSDEQGDQDERKVPDYASPDWVSDESDAALGHGPRRLPVPARVASAARGGSGPARGAASPSKPRQKRGAAAPQALDYELPPLPPPSLGAPIRGVAGLVAVSRESREALGKAQQAAVDLEVLLLVGELGTGKKTHARAIHAWSNRSKRPFLHFPCGAWRDTEAERRLFGWTEGRTRGGGTAQPGQVERARAGVLFLEDVELLSGSAQARLDQLLASGVFCRVGSDEEVEADLKVIAATTRNLKDEVERGAFDRDL
ncbi:MAG: sigma 54-interacting transcriptional regulator, partial [Candidatus Wallbacteria bacterium]|nr:sigma 54-interacting transcriptional regulator [Candidatus Wallbacteria bacterium]